MTLLISVVESGLAGIVAPMRIGFVRQVPESINDCELTYLERRPIDLANARRQHGRYVALLTSLGVEIHQLPAMDDRPDSVFVEDTALVLDELAIITRPGAPSRRSEVVSTADALGPYRKCERIEAPATLDGGDIVVVGRRIFVGLTTRSNNTAIDHLGGIVESYGYTVEGVAVTGCLHLKSAATAIGPNAVLFNPEWVDEDVFGDIDLIRVHEDEPQGANALMIGDELVYAAEFPRTLERLAGLGYVVHTVAASELAKAEGAVTCCSLIVEAGAA